MSNSTHPLLWGTAGGVLALALYIAVDQWFAPQAPVYTQPSAPIHSPAPSHPVSQTSVQPRAADSLPQQPRARISAELPNRYEDSAPAAKPASAVSSQPASALSQQQSEEAAQMHSIQTRLSSLMQQNPHEIDVAKLDGVLADLQTLRGDGDYIGNVNITLVRQNLATSHEAVALSKEIEAAVKRGATEEELLAYQAQMKSLQTKINPMVTAPVGAAK